MSKTQEPGTCSDDSVPRNFPPRPEDQNKTTTWRRKHDKEMSLFIYCILRPASAPTRNVQNPLSGRAAPVGQHQPPGQGSDQPAPDAAVPPQVR